VHLLPFRRGIMIAELISQLRRMGYRAAWTALERCTTSPDIETVFQRGANGRSLDYVKKVRGLSHVEPTLGYVLTPSGLPIEDSLCFNHPRAPYPFQIGVLAPTMPSRSNSRMRCPAYDTIVSFRHHHEDNYYHFVIDVLGALELLDASGLPGDLPIVIGGPVARTRFGSEILETAALASRNWILQDESIWAENVVFLRTYQPSRARADHLLDLMEVPVPSDHEGERIYLSRPPGMRRSVLNNAEVAAALQKYGFREVVTDDLSIQEQIQIFQRARFIVGTHGAGLTNIIYRRGAALALLELHSYAFFLNCYGELCEEYGYRHERLPCLSETSSRWGESRLWVDTSQLELRVRGLLAESQRVA
jgi:Glycosyltransferase 61